MLFMLPAFGAAGGGAKITLAHTMPPSGDTEAVARFGKAGWWLGAVTAFLTGEPGKPDEPLGNLWVLNPKPKPHQKSTPIRLPLPVPQGS